MDKFDALDDFVRKASAILSLRRDLLVGDVWILLSLHRYQKQHGDAEKGRFANPTIKKLHELCHLFYGTKHYNSFQRRLTKLKALGLINIRAASGREKEVLILTPGVRVLMRAATLVQETPSMRDLLKRK